MVYIPEPDILSGAASKLGWFAVVSPEQAREALALAVWAAREKNSLIERADIRETVCAGMEALERAGAIMLLPGIRRSSRGSLDALESHYTEHGCRGGACSEAESLTYRYRCGARVGPWLVCTDVADEVWGNPPQLLAEQPPQQEIAAAPAVEPGVGSFLCDCGNSKLAWLPRCRDCHAALTGQPVRAKTFVGVG